MSNPTFRQKILEYCEKNRIEVPPGFGRNTPARYAVIRTDLTPPKLVATTWSKQEDLIYYFEHALVGNLGFAVAKSIPVRDFKTGRRFRFAEHARLLSDGNFIVEG